jgi:hypothetical protein
MVRWEGWSGEGTGLPPSTGGPDGEPNWGTVARHCQSKSFPQFVFPRWPEGWGRWEADAAPGGGRGNLGKFLGSSSRSAGSPGTPAVVMCFDSRRLVRTASRAVAQNLAGVASQPSSYPSELESAFFVVNLTGSYFSTPSQVFQSRILMSRGAAKVLGQPTR